VSVGRPTKYKPEYCKLLIDHMAEGYSFESFAGIVGVSKQTIYDWLERHVEFLDAKRQAFAKSRLFWERAGISGMYMGGKDNPFNSTVWVFNMKNRFGWRDNIKQEIEQTTEVKVEITPDEQEL
jgi:hypothetical protein